MSKPPAITNRPPDVCTDAAESKDIAPPSFSSESDHKITSPPAVVIENPAFTLTFPVDFNVKLLLFAVLFMFEFTVTDDAVTVKSPTAIFSSTFDASILTAEPEVGLIVPAE